MSNLIVGRAAVLVIDMQHDFVDPGAACYAIGAEEIVSRIGSVVVAARRAGIPVIFTQEAHRPGGVDAGREADGGTGDLYSSANTGSAVPAHCVEGTAGIEIVDELAPAPGDLRIVKRRYSCFLGTDLELLLGNLEIQTLIVSGVCSDVCVLWTVGEAFQRDYHVRLLEDCVAGTTREASDAAVKIMTGLIGWGGLTGDRLVRELGAASSPMASAAAPR